MKRSIALTLALALVMTVLFVMPASAATEWGAPVWSCTDWVQNPSNQSYRDGYWSLIAISGWGGTAPTIGVDSEDETNTCLTTTTGGIRVELVDTLYNMVDEDGKSAMNTPEADLYLFEFDYKSEHGNFAITKFWNYASNSGMANAPDMPEVVGTTLPAQSEWTHVALPFVVDEDCGPWGGFRLENLYGQGVAKFDNFSLKRATAGTTVVANTYAATDYSDWTLDTNVWWAETTAPEIQTVEGNTYVYSNNTNSGGLPQISLTANHVSDAVSTSGVDTYLVEFDYKTPKATVEFSAAYQHANGAAYDNSVAAVLPAAADWTRFKATIIVEDTADLNGNINYRFLCKGAGEFYLDNFSFKKIFIIGFEADNMVKNGGFEDGIAGVYASNWTFSKYAAAGESVMPALMVADGNSYLAQSGWGGVASQEIAIPTGATGPYMFKFDYKNSLKENFWIRLTGDDGIAYIDTNPGVVDSVNWNTYSNIIYLDNFKGTKLTFTLTGTRDGNSLCLDNVVLKKVKGYDGSNLFADQGFEYFTEHTTAAVDINTVANLTANNAGGYIVTGGAANTVTSGTFPAATEGAKLAWRGSTGVLEFLVKIGDTTNGNYYKNTGLMLNFDFNKPGANHALTLGLKAGSTGDGLEVESASNPSIMDLTIAGTSLKHWQWNDNVSLDITPFLKDRALWQTADTLIIRFWSGPAGMAVDDLRVTPKTAHIQVTDADETFVSALPVAAEDLTATVTNYSASAGKFVVATYSTGASGKQVLESVSAPVDVASMTKLTQTLSSMQAATGKTVKIFVWDGSNTPLGKNITLK